MSADANSVLLTFPPRELSADERVLLCEWLACAAGDAVGAFEYKRCSDDPALFRRIAVIDSPDGRPNYLIYQPKGLTTWIKVTVGPYVHVEKFQTLSAALISIRPALGASIGW